MRRAGEHGLCIILFTPCHTLDALAASVLTLIGRNGLALDITHICKGIYAVLLGNEVLNVNLAADIDDFGTSLVGILVADCGKLFLDNFLDSVLGAENFKVFLDFLHQLVALGNNLVDFKTCQLT